MKIIIFFIVGIFFFLFPIFGVRALGCCVLYAIDNGYSYCSRDRDNCGNPGTMFYPGEWIANGMCNRSETKCIPTSAPLSKGTTSSSSEYKSPVILWTPQITVPFSEFRKGEALPIADSLVARYVVAIFSFVVILGGFLAFVRAVISGAQWALAAGDSGKITAAKEALKNSLIGLVVILSSYQILQLLSKNLTGFSNLSIESVRKINLDVIGYCPGVMLQEIESKGNLLVNAKDKKVNSNYLTQKILEEAADAVFKETNNQLVISSAIRMVKDQELLYASWLCFKSKNPDTKLTEVEEKDLNQIRAKYGNISCTQSSKAAKPDCEKSPHLIGSAIDVNLHNPNNPNNSILSGKANQQATLSQDDRALIYKLQKAMHSKGLKHICIEWWHFEIQGTGKDSNCDVGCHYLTDDNKVGGDKKRCWDENGVIKSS